MESRHESGCGGAVKKRVRLLPWRRSVDRRASAVGLFVQLTLIAIIVPALVVPVAIDFLRDDAGGPIVPEQISFQVLLPTDGDAERRPARDGGDGRPAVPDATPAEAPPVIAPSETPAAIPPAPSTDAPTGFGPLVGGGGPTLGIRPTFTDARLWVSPSDIVIAPIVPLTRADTLRLMLRSRAIAMMDSVARLPSDAGRQGDWTFGRDGKKWGIDQGFIRLGNFSIPTAVLAMLPMNVQSNPLAAERARRLNSLRDEIQAQAARSIRDDAFRKAVQALRERKERERREAEEAAATAQKPTVPPATPTTPDRPEAR